MDDRYWILIHFLQGDIWRNGFFSYIYIWRNRLAGRKTTTSTRCGRVGSKRKTTTRKFEWLYGWAKLPAYIPTFLSLPPTIVVKLHALARSLRFALGRKSMPSSIREKSDPIQWDSVSPLRKSYPVVWLSRHTYHTFPSFQGSA